MKAKHFLSFAIMLALSLITMAQYDPNNPSNPYPNSDFSSLSPSRHMLYYNITDSITHTVKVSGLYFPHDDADTMHCGLYVVVPQSVQYNGMTSTVTSVGEKWVYGGVSFVSKINVQLPTTILSLEDSAFTGNCTPIFHSQQPPIIDTTTFVGCQYIHVPCGRDSVYQNAWSNNLNGAIILEVQAKSVCYLVNLSVGSVSFGLGCWNDTNYVGLYARPTYDYYVFSHWADGNTDSVRTVELHGDSCFLVYFEKKHIRTYSTLLPHWSYDWLSFWDDWDSFHYGSVEGPTLAPWGDSVTLTAHANHGYEFVRWKYPYVYDSIIFDYNTNDSVNTRWIRYQYTTDTILSYATVFNYYDYLCAEAQFKKKRFSFSVESEDWNKGWVNYYHDNFSPIYDSVLYRCSATIRADSRTGYKFTHWSDGDTNAIRTITIIKDTALIAYFEGIPVEVSVTNVTPEFGSFSGDGVYHYGDTVTLVAHPIEHYHFLSWINNSYGHVQVYEEDTLAFVVTQDTVFELRFEIDRHHVEVTPNNIAYGSVYGTNDYEYGTAASVGAHPYSGYQFLRWSNGVTYNPYTFAVLCDTSLTAIFAEEGTVYNVTATANDPAMGIVTGGSIYAAGEQATLTAIPYDGYRFNHWQDNNTDNPRTITVNSDMSFTAYFESDGTQGIEDMSGETEEVRVYASNGCIVIGTQATTPADVNVYDITGRCIATATVAAGNDARVPVSGNGVYIVKVTNLPAKKVVVIR